MPEHTPWQLEEQDFWNFSLTLYAQPGVMENCLLLQDNFQLNVNMVLFCCFAGHLRLTLDDGWLTALHQATQRSEARITQHRQQRKLYKQKASINQGEMFDPGHYQQLKQQELDLEKQQQSDVIAAAQAQQAQLSFNPQTNEPNTKGGGLARYASLFASTTYRAGSDHQSQLKQAISVIQLASQTMTFCKNNSVHHAAPK